jgi:hypothetical protein
MKIATDHIYPPIPIRSFDWMAYDADTYDGAPDAGPQTVGYGATKEDAITDFLDDLFKDRCLTSAEQKAQGARCSCRGSDEYCGCQNVEDSVTRKIWREEISFELVS